MAELPSGAPLVTHTTPASMIVGVAPGGIKPPSAVRPRASVWRAEWMEATPLLAGEELFGPSRCVPGNMPVKRACARIQMRSHI
jgi:hypothetical protein